MSYVHVELDLPHNPGLRDQLGDLGIIVANAAGSLKVTTYGAPQDGDVQRFAHPGTGADEGTPADPFERTIAEYDQRQAEKAAQKAGKHSSS